MLNNSFLSLMLLISTSQLFNKGVDLYKLQQNQLLLIHFQFIIDGKFNIYSKWLKEGEGYLGRMEYAVKVS